MSDASIGGHPARHGCCGGGGGGVLEFSDNRHLIFMNSSTIFADH